MSTHPHFDDGEAVTWFTSFAEAVAEAQEKNKNVFIECGRVL